MKKLILLTMIFFTGFAFGQKDTLNYTKAEMNALFAKVDSLLHQEALLDSLQALRGEIAAKQDLLVSGTNIKTVNSTTLLGSGDVSISSDTTGFWAIVNGLVEDALAESDTTIGTVATLDSLIADYWAGTLGADTTGYWAMIYAVVEANMFDTTNVYTVTDSLASDIATKLTASTYTAFIETMAGGTTDQVLTKVNATDYNWNWSTFEGGEIVADTIPNNFEFDDVTNATLSAYYSDYIVVAGCDSARFYPASGDTIRIGALGTKRVAPTWADNGDTVYTFCVASGSNSTTTRSIVYSANGTPVDSFNVTTVSGGYSAETLAYETRVEADGGEVISMDAVEAAYASGIDLDNLQLWAGAKFGIKKNANNKVTVMYDLSNNDNDLIQADTSLAPTSFAPDSILFYRGRYMVSTFNAAATQPITIVMASNFLWKNETGTDQIYDGLDGSNRHNLQNQGTDRDFFAGTDFVSTTSLPSSDVVFTVVTNTTDSLFINNSYATSGDAGSHSLGGIYLNSANGGGASGTQIPLFEILVYDGTGIRATAESNINTRWSIY